MDIKNLDMETIRKYIIYIIIIGILIAFRDIFIGLAISLFSVFGINLATELPPGFMFMLFAIGLFGFALFFMMIIQKKKLTRTSKTKDIHPKGFCDICKNPKAKNVLIMQYLEKDKNPMPINVCEICRNEIKEIKENDKKESKSS